MCSFFCFREVGLIKKYQPICSEGNVMLGNGGWKIRSISIVQLKVNALHYYKQSFVLAIFIKLFLYLSNSTFNPTPNAQNLHKTTSIETVAAP